MLDPLIEPANPFTEAEITKIEKAIGRSIPNDYRNFATEYGGAFVGGLIDGDEELPILTFFSADAVLAKLLTLTDLKDDGVLPVADCELGNLYVINRDNSVHYINYYGGQTSSKKVSDKFSDLLHRIVVTDD
ncbi:MAG: SMI1/KNR4 family protein [Kiritimatiellae bacterium]|nr:SMI1/KNR4 family protein [Kiritimatiellia bacterium]